MYQWMPEVCHELRGHLLEIYWLLLIPFMLFLVILEFFKLPEQEPNVGRVLKRTIISMLLIWSFDEMINVIAMIGDGVSGRIGGLAQLQDLVDGLKDKWEDADAGWLDFRELWIYALNTLSYILAYCGVFMANAVVHFVWGVLFILSPLMILMYVLEKTSFVTGNLYKGLINVISWKCLWSILGVMLVKFAAIPQSGGADNFIMSAVINLMIVLSMMLVPFFARNLITDGLTTIRTLAQALPGAVILKKIKTVGRALDKKLVSGPVSRGSKSLGRFAARNAWQGTKAGVKEATQGFPKTRGSIRRGTHRGKQVFSRINNAGVTVMAKNQGWRPANQVKNYAPNGVGQKSLGANFSSNNSNPIRRNNYRNKK